MLVSAIGRNYIPRHNFSAKPVSCCGSGGGQNNNDLRVFFHHIYEYKKGVRSLILTTEKASNKEAVKKRLNNERIPYIIQDVNDKSINVFFGNEDCLRVVSSFGNKKLNQLSPEQDFMLGIMLGYDKVMQCQRYFKMKERAKV